VGRRRCHRRQQGSLQRQGASAGTTLTAACMQSVNTRLESVNTRLNAQMHLDGSAADARGAYYT